MEAQWRSQSQNDWRGPKVLADLHTETNVSNLLIYSVLLEIRESSSNARYNLAEKSVKLVKLVINLTFLAFLVKLVNLYTDFTGFSGFLAKPGILVPHAILAKTGKIMALQLD